MAQSASPITTVGALKEKIASEAHPLHGQFLAAMFAGIDPSSPLAIERIVEVLVKGEARRREVTGAQHRCAPAQVAFHGLQVLVLRLAAPSIKAFCKNLSPAQVVDALEPLAKIVASAQSGELHHLIFASRGMRRTARVQRARPRQKHLHLESALGIPGLLSSLASDDDAFCLEEFAAEMFRLQLREAMVLASAASIQDSAKIETLVALRDGTLEPDARHTAAVRELALTTGRSRLYDCFQFVLDRTYKGSWALDHDVDFQQFIVPYRAELERMFEFEARRPGMRNGRKGVKAPLAPASKRAYSDYYAHIFAGAHLPAGPDIPARMRGLGLSASGFLVAIRSDVIEAERALRCARRDGGTLLRADAEYYRKMADFCAKGGALWTLAADFLEKYPDAAAGMPTAWPNLPTVDRPGMPCANPVERVRAQCYVAHHRFLALAREASQSPPSAAFHRRLGELFRVHRQPLVGALRLALRVRAAAPTGALHYYDNLVLAYLALASVRPMRITDTTDMEPLSVEATPARDLVFLRLGKPGKNGDSYMVQIAHGLPVAVAKPLVDFVLPYHDLRPKEASQHWVHPDGTPLRAEDLRYHLERVALTYAPELFPFGFGAHDMRTIVASDLLARYGAVIGARLAAEALRDAEWTIESDYNCCQNPLPEVPVNHIPSQVDAIELAYAEAIAAEEAQQKTPGEIAPAAN